MKISLIGCGKMASSLALGFYNKNPHLKFFGFNPTFEKTQVLMEKVGGISFKEIKDLPPSDIYLLGAKPQHFKEMARMLSPYLPQDALIVSILAGIPVKMLSSKLNTQRVIRVMPNTPCAVGAGVSSIFFGDGIKEEEKKQIKDLFAAVGSVFELSLEEQINISTVFTGSGPGFLFEIARIMHSKILEKGIEPKMATEMINQTFLGAAKLMIQSGKTYEFLRESVTSKGGTTEAGLSVFKEKDLSGILGESLEVSLNRCLTLGEQDD
jgi:pyrroline-5-carboxylate reductase